MQKRCFNSAWNKYDQRRCAEYNWLKNGSIKVKLILQRNVGYGLYEGRDEDLSCQSWYDLYKYALGEMQNLASEIHI